MPGNPKQKMKLLYLKELIEKYTDEQHSITVQELIDRLAELGIASERKSIYTDVEILQEYGMDIRRGRGSMKGYYLVRHGMQLPEVRIIMDAVQASPAITRERTHEIIEKLQGMVSAPQAQLLESQVYIDERNKSENEEFFLSVEKIHSAIAKGRKIKFIYHHRQLVNNRPIYDAGREFIISPYAAIWNDDKYYLVGNYEKYDNLSHYRIDRMRGVECLEEALRPHSQVCSCDGPFDVAAYAKNVFNMFAGDEQVQIELICENALLDTIVEKFGPRVPYKKLDDEHFSVRVTGVINDGLVKWILNFGGKVYANSPPKLVQEVRKMLYTMTMVYRAVQ